MLLIWGLNSQIAESLIAFVFLLLLVVSSARHVLQHHGALLPQLWLSMMQTSTCTLVTSSSISQRNNPLLQVQVISSYKRSHESCLRNAYIFPLAITIA